MRRALLLAHPAGHSLSPLMHEAAFAALGLDARYEARDVPPEGLADAVGELRAGDVLGANVSVPHKQAILPLMDVLSDAARAVGAVNTVVATKERLLGDNTDAEGFTRAIAEAGVSPRGRRVLLVGAGGAARAVGWALLRGGVEELRIWNRTEARALALAEALRDAAPGRAHAAGARACTDVREAADACDWFVNTTSVGMARGGVDPDESPLPADVWPSAGVAVDAVYRPRRTRFLRDAEGAGVRTIDGLGMLLHQGAVALERWTGRQAPLEVMRAALERGMRQEGREPAGRES